MRKVQENGCIGKEEIKSFKLEVECTIYTVKSSGKKVIRYVLQYKYHSVLCLNS